MRFNGAETIPNGIISQVLAIQPGKPYEVALHLADHAADAMRVRIEVFDGAEGSTGENLLIAEQRSYFPGVIYIRTNAEFMSASAVVTLIITDISTTTNSTDLLIDNVSVTLIEPFSVSASVRLARRAELQLPTRVGRTYTIQASTTLDGTFSPIRTIVGDGSIPTFCDSRDLEIETVLPGSRVRIAGGLAVARRKPSRGGPADEVGWTATPFE